MERGLDCVHYRFKIYESIYFWVFNSKQRADLVETLMLCVICVLVIDASCLHCSTSSAPEHICLVLQEFT